MAAIPFVDTHFHLHDMTRPELRYTWLEPKAIHPFLGQISSLKSQAYRIEDYIAEIRFANVPKAIHVQAALGIPDPVDETKWLQEFADQFGYPHGIVAECHLARPDAQQVLERHLRYANVRGIRDFGDGDYLMDPTWRAGFKLLGRFNLVSCIDTRVSRLGKLADLAKNFPDVQICVDHCAIPEQRDPDYQALWRKAIGNLAKVPNVTMKISGLGMGDHSWTVDTIRPYVLGSIDAFGPQRVVFGTNWPVDRMYSSYPDVIDAYAEIIAGFTPAEQRAMFAGNAERLFRI
jgi:predicted TIM-barrel fold metal-dependent hydrolase